jgi:hypothetical protein
MRLKLLIGAAVMAGLATACNTGQETASSSNVGQPAAATHDAAGTDNTTSNVGTTDKSASDATSWTMPNEHGKDLQSAQDDIQSITGDGIFFTRSHDATGRGRRQFLDRDWQVCSQNVRPGARVTADSDIVFNVVRVETESCP